METTKTIQMLPVAELKAHPQNPRRDLGDLTELADSIRENGVLQNLTVVPWLGEVTGQPTGDYKVIIGHRRLAAAKQADPITGLVPYGCGGVEPDLCSQCQGFNEPTDEEDAADD